MVTRYWTPLEEFVNEALGFPFVATSMSVGPIYGRTAPPGGGAGKPWFQSVGQMWLPCGCTKAPNESDRDHARRCRAFAKAWGIVGVTQRQLMNGTMGVTSAPADPPLESRKDAERRIEELLDDKLGGNRDDEALLFHVLVQRGWTRDDAKSRLQKRGWWLS